MKTAMLVGAIFVAHASQGTLMCWAVMAVVQFAAMYWASRAWSSS